MAASVISISSNLSDESVGSSIPRVILIGYISVEVLVAPEVGVAAVASPVGVLELDTHSLSKADPSESSLPLVSVAPMVSPFLCSDDPESDTEMSGRYVSPTPHDVIFARWRSRVASQSSSPTTSTPEIPTALIPPAPSAIVALSTDIISPIDAPPGIIHSSGHSISGHSVSGHTPPVTTIADSSAPSRFVYPPLARTPRYREAYRRWRSAPSSTMYPPMTSESSAGDSSSESSAGPSCKRCRSPTATGFYFTTKDSVKEDIDTDVLADIKADATAVEVAINMDIKAGVDAGIGIKVDVGVDIEDEVEGEVKSSDRGTMEVGVDVVVGIDNSNDMLMPDAIECLEQVVHNIYGHVMEIPLQRVEDIELGQRELEARSLISSRESATLLDYVASLKRSNARLLGTLRMESARADRFRRRMGFMESELKQIHRFCYYD
ncbi:hypothetical protein Tco_1490450, partial [Tanacetum coccineum]